MTLGDLSAPADQLQRALDRHAYFIGIARAVSKRSKDPSTKVGCVLVSKAGSILSTGYNDFARGVRDRIHAPGGDEVAARWQRPRKYNFVVHAELNAILNAARVGTPLEGCVAYLNYAPCCCTGCANALVQVGCTAIIGPDIKFPGVGAGDHYDVSNDAFTILREAQVQLITIPFEDSV